MFYLPPLMTPFQVNLKLLLPSLDCITTELPAPLASVLKILKLSTSLPIHANRRGMTHGFVVVDLIQRMFATGELPQMVPWSYLAVIPKPGGGTCDLGLLDIIWKLVEAIIDTRVNSKVKLHDVLHGFVNRRSTGTATIEATPNKNW